jgi:prepilin-type N-terminal cleavage/methylation domain-containing protein
MIPAPRATPGQRGFSLLEALIALSLLAVLLLMGGGLVLQQPRTMRRIDVQRHELQALDSTLEAIRAGALPLVSTRIDVPGGPIVWIEVAPAGAPPVPADLYRVSLRALQQTGGKTVERRLDSLVWRPGS